MEGKAQEQEKESPLETIVAVLIALVTVIGAVVVWRASVIEDASGDADFAGLRASINAEELKGDGAFALFMTRIDDQGEETFYNDEITLKAGGVVYVYFAEWKGNGTPVDMAIDSNGDGEIDEAYTSGDES